MHSPLRTIPAAMALSVALHSLPVYAVNSTMLNLVMPEARVVAGADVNRIKGSPFGQFLLRQMDARPAELEKFAAITGFDPRKDLQEILVASTDGGKRGKSLVLARGLFDESKLTDLALGHNGALTSYKGVKLLASTGEKGEAVAFPGGNLIVAGSLAVVEAAIDRLQSEAKASAELVSLTNSADASYDAWIVTLGPPSTLAPRVPDPTVGSAMKGDLFQAVQQAIGGVRFAADIEVGGEAVTRSEKDATALADVLRFLATMVVSNKPAGDPLVRAAESLQVSTSANRTRFLLRIPETEFEKLVPMGRKPVRTRPVSTAVQ